MHLWVLCLKLWWLTLPLGTLQHPSKLEGRTTDEELKSRNTEITSKIPNPSVGAELDERALPAARAAPQPLVFIPDGRNGWRFLPENIPVPPNYILNPYYIRHNLSGILTNQTSNNPFSYVGRDPYPPDPGPYPPDPGPYPPDPYPPGPDPFPPSDPDVWAFDWSYPPFGSKKIIRIKGELNLKTNDILFDVWILGWPLETGGGNLDQGVFINVNIAVAKGYLKIYDKPGPQKDEVRLLADLHLPFRQHFWKDIHMFNIPHHGPPPKAEDLVANA